MRKLLLLLFTLIPAVVWAQRYDLSGRVLVKGTDKPIAQAVVELPQAGLWAVADGDGNFTVKGVPKGATRFVVSCLGYATTETELDVRAGMGRILLYAPEDNLKLESVVVTAKEAPNAMATSRTIGGNAIDHLQMVNASDISSLLPGGKTINPDLTKDNVFSLRSGGSAAGNASFGTAVEVDGVRISTNASLGEMSGASTRNIASTNIESVEVVTGVPSAEYGDISSGVVKISTRKGKTPYTLVLSTNPRTKQISASKGFDLGTDRGVLNSSVEYTRAILFAHGHCAQLPEHLRQGPAFQLRRDGQHRRHEYRRRPRRAGGRVGEGARQRPAGQYVAQMAAQQTVDHVHRFRCFAQLCRQARTQAHLPIVGHGDPGRPCRKRRLLYRRNASGDFLYDAQYRLQAARLCGEPQGHLGPQLGRRA